jgi:hypothetical protein
MAGTNKPKKRLGQPLAWTEEQLTKLSQINPSDEQAANVVWKENAPKGFEGLLNAKVVEEDGNNQ